MRYSHDARYSLALHDDALDDLDRLYELDEDAAADIEAFLEEAKLNQHTLDNFTRNGYVHYEDPSYDIKELVERKARRFNLWRLRLLWLEGASDHRIVYAFHPIELRYYILGIVPRSFNYERDHELTRRIEQAYEALDIPRR